MAIESAIDRAAMLSDWDSAIYTPPGFPHPSSKSSTISGIFNRNFVDPFTAESYGPTFETATELLTDIGHDAQLRINSVDYKVKGVQPEPDGAMTLLILERQT